jgi:hypothetical protein
VGEYGGNAATAQADRQITERYMSGGWSTRFSPVGTH